MDMQKTQVKDLFRRNLPLLSALGDGQRQQILLLMTDEHRLSVGEIARRTQISRPAVSHHIKVLKEADLLSEQREGTRIYYQPKFDTHIAPMRAFLDAIETMICTYDTNSKGKK
jgi:DNA-binding transcriptional ArsR family regulator